MAGTVPDIGWMDLTNIRTLQRVALVMRFHGFLCSWRLNIVMDPLKQLARMIAGLIQWRALTERQACTTESFTIHGWSPRGGANPVSLMAPIGGKQVYRLFPGH